jgi:glucose-1-phosphate cytidylyltransferase
MRMGNQEIPKPLVEVGERPILWHVMKIYAAQGFTNFILALGYRGDLIKRYFLEYDWQSRDFTLSLGDGVKNSVGEEANGTRSKGHPEHSQGTCNPVFHTPHDAAGWQITFVETGLHTQTGARIRKAARYVKADRFFVTYADGVGDVDLRALLSFHKAQGLLGTMTGVRSFSRFGVVETDKSGEKVTGFQEKPLEVRVISGGFFVFEPAFLTYLQGDDSVQLEQEPLRRLAAEGQLALYRHQGFWRAMDTFKDVHGMNALWESSAPWKIW